MSAQRSANAAGASAVVRCVEEAAQAFALEGESSSVEPPPVDTVLFWLSRRVEQDFVRRGVFPNLRYGNAKGFQGGATLHYLSPSEAAIVLADAVERHEPSNGANALNGYDRRSFTDHIAMLRSAMEEAEQRRLEFQATELVCRRRDDDRECWTGTKEQLGALGIHLDGPWPREPGGKRRWAKTRDGRGYTTHITVCSTMWPGRFEARIEIPYDVQTRKAASARTIANADRAARTLEEMPASEGDFRNLVINGLCRAINWDLKMRWAPSDWHGYTLGANAFPAIQAAFNALKEAIEDSEVFFDADLHERVAQGYRAEIAAADNRFQSQFARLVRPNPSILEGGAP